MPESSPAIKIIPLAAAIALLEDCSAVIIDNVVTYPTLSDTTGAADNEFLRLTWTDEEGDDFTYTFSEGKNSTAKVCDSVLSLVDDDGDETPLTLLAPMKLEAELPAAPANNAGCKAVTVVVELMASVPSTTTDEEISDITVRLDTAGVKLEGKAGPIQATVTGYTTTSVLAFGDEAEDDSDYSREDWQAEVTNGDTKLGYREWVAHRRESESTTSG